MAQINLAIKRYGSFRRWGILWILRRFRKKYRTLGRKMEIEIGPQVEILDAHSNDTQEWQEAHMKYGKLTEESVKRIGLSIGFERLGELR